MLRRSLFLAIALATVAGAIALWMRAPGADRQSLSAAPIASAGQDRASSDLIDPAPERADERSPLTPLATNEDALVPAAVVTQRTTVKYGFVFGQVMDQLGTPIGNRKVVFRRAPGVLGGQYHEAESDPDGHYRDRDESKRWRTPPAVRLETGTWFVFCDEHDERAWLDSVSRRLMGSVEVLEDRIAHFDVTFEGGRTLRGRLDYDDPAAHETGGSLLQLQLVSVWEPDAPVGDAVLEFAKGKPWFNVDLPEEEMRQRLAEQGKEYPKYELGAFQFSGLRAEPHLLRVILDVKGEWVWEREVDLSVGDVDLGGIPLEDSMFWKRALPADESEAAAQAND